jgi:hypothetical protein
MNSEIELMNRKYLCMLLCSRGKRWAETWMLQSVTNAYVSSGSDEGGILSGRQWLRKQSVSGMHFGILQYVGRSICAKGKNILRYRTSSYHKLKNTAFTDYGTYIGSCRHLGIQVFVP